MPENKSDTHISIGPDDWIAHGNFERDQKVIYIDSKLKAVIPFIESLETGCVAGCCGIDAFGLWPEEIKTAVAGYEPSRIESLIFRFLEIEEAVAGMNCNVVCSKRMNACFRVEVFLQLSRHIRGVLEGLLSRASG